MADQNTQFDPDKQRRDNDQTRELKANNIRAVFGTGAGRVAIIAVALAMVSMVAFGLYNLFSPKALDQRAAPADAMLGVTGRDGDPVAGNAAEARARAAQNAVEASQAAAQGKAYMAPPLLVASNAQALAPVGEDAMAPASQPADAVPVAPGRPARAGVTDAQIATTLGYRTVSAAIGASEVTPQIISVARGQDPTQQHRAAPYQIAYYPVDDAQQSTGSARGAAAQTPMQAGVPSAAASAAGSAATAVKHAVPGFGAGDAFYCKIYFGMNSDLPRRDAMAKCFGGAADGATFIGRAEASTEGVAEPGFTVTFDKLKLPGRNTLEVNAVAVDVGTMEENVADDVSSHGFVKFSELALAGLLKGIGQIANQQQAQQTTQSVGAVSTSTYATLKPDAFQIVGGALGGVGTAVGELFQKKSDALKTTIKVWPNKDIGVVLFSDVME
ncbi:hypothetical protein FAZ69_08380 [Trinickia terrae]|uniref:Uncharacterized protein n=1 Tax=Trinickia terrae TaxID=2571161 RepID=A0A4U1I9Y9_9BURK|nr:TrbI/VirB10 family protein [Trinickia terrae]TKC90155.1 hypothetical protein FAZ69_08380 [Trinickia terrae]